MNLPPLALYVHFPWCVRKCPYCDFNSHPLNQPLDEARYTAALLEDIDEQLIQNPVRPIVSVFFGGGTPSLFSPDAFAQILKRLAPNLAPGVEVTMEANPGTTEHHDFGGYHEAGINRISFGAQSFDDRQLEALGRIHQASETVRSVQAARRAGFDNINLDLMYGLPGQTTRDAAADLEAALALEPEHLSWYQLTLEPRTEFARRPPTLPTDIFMEAIEDRGYQILGRAGFERYEVSAYSQPDRRCQHNLNYWSFGDYLGAGAGAHGKITGIVRDAEIQRTAKPRQPRLYLATPSVIAHSTLSRSELPGEFMLNALRLVDGVPLQEFEARTGLPLSVLSPVRDRQIEAGLLHEDRLAATPRGYAMLDSLIADYL